MESRVGKYSSDVPSRSARNARLYKEVYGKYSDLDHLPLEDNTDEIDMDKLQEILYGSKAKEQRIEEENQLNVIEQRKRNIDEQRVYDINKILEKAKYENHKLRDNVPTSKIDTSILSTLESRDVSEDEVLELSDSYANKKTEDDDNLSMTRELKFKELSLDVNQQSNPLMEHVMPDSDLSLDLLQDLKPTENTIITSPIRDTSVSKDIPKLDKIEEINFHSGDTRDIDIIKKGKDDDFFTSSYEFSDSDFLDGPVKSNGVFKIVLLILAIIVFAGVIAYFVINYGFGT